MKSKNYILNLLLLCISLAISLTLITGCVNVPKISGPDPGITASASVSHVSSHLDLPNGGIVHPNDVVTSTDVPVKSHTRSAIQKTVNWFAVLCVLGGVAALVFGGLAISGGQVFAGIKLVLVGVLLPIFGIWFAYHWLAVVICGLAALAAYEFVIHWAVVRPVFQKLEADVIPSLTSLENKFLTLVHLGAAKAVSDAQVKFGSDAAAPAA